MEFCAIVVDVSRPEAICLIEIPYSRDFLRVSRAIERAANNINAGGQPFRPVRVDQLPKGERFPDEIVDLTRRARMVVAVCTPQRNGEHLIPNPNVMYETGLAMALGKPLLILTTDPKSLPADIGDLSAVKYRADEAEGTLVSQIEAEMWKLLAKTSWPRRPGYDDIWVAHARHRMLLRHEFWRSFGIVFQYASAVRDEMEDVFHAFVHRLQRFKQDIVENDAEIKEFSEVWRAYLAHYENTTTDVLRQPAGLGVALGTLDQLAGRSDAAQQVDCIDRFAKIFQWRLTHYANVHNEARQVCKDFLNDCESWELRNQFDHKISSFVEEVKELSRYSGTLVRNLAKLVATGFSESDAPSSDQGRSAAA